MEEQILVRITGQDRPGLTASVMGILAKYNAQILDIGQADIHSTLSLGILIRIDEMHSGQVMKELLFKATELGVNIGFSPVADDEVLMGGDMRQHVINMRHSLLEEAVQQFCAGDNDNDVSMLKIACVSVVPSDAHPNARAQATVIVPPPEEDGVENYLRTLLHGPADIPFAVDKKS